MVDMAAWHRQEEGKDRSRVSEIAARDDLPKDVKKRRMKFWADHADWHDGRAQLWEKIEKGQRNG